MKFILLVDGWMVFLPGLHHVLESLRVAEVPTQPKQLPE